MNPYKSFLELIRYENLIACYNDSKDHLDCTDLIAEYGKIGIDVNCLDEYKEGLIKARCAMMNQLSETSNDLTDIMSSVGESLKLGPVCKLKIIQFLSGISENDVAICNIDDKEFTTEFIDAMDAEPGEDYVGIKMPDSLACSKVLGTYKEILGELESITDRQLLETKIHQLRLLEKLFNIIVYCNFSKTEGYESFDAFAGPSKGIEVMNDTIDVYEGTEDIGMTESDLTYMQSVYDGLESFICREFNTKNPTPNQLKVMGIMEANGFFIDNKVDGTEGFVQWLKDAINKVIDSLKSFFKSIKDFFTKNSKDTEKVSEDATDKLKEISGDLGDKDDIKVPEGAFDSLAETAEANDQSDLAKLLKSAKDKSGLTSLANAATKLYDTIKKNLSDAESEVNSAESGTSDISGIANGVSDDVTTEEKQTVKESLKEKTDYIKNKATEGMEKAKRARILAKLQSAIASKISSIAKV